MNDDFWGVVIVLGLVLGIVLFIGKGCTEDQAGSRLAEQKKLEALISAGYIEVEYCAANAKKWVKP